VLKVHLTRTLMRSLLAFAHDQYPNEMLVLLRGKRSGESLLVHQVVFAPFMLGGRSSSTFNPYQVPIDSSIVGTAHSHPSGVTRPSVEDLLHPYGSVMMIVGYPFREKEDVAIYDSKGRPLEWEVIEDEE
jgi:proteasome lid subunit RPN8/RPN11